MANFLAKIWPSLAAPHALSAAETVGFYATRIIGAVFLLCYAYQFFYIFIACIKSPKTYPAAPHTKRYAAVIAARNEQAVLPALLESIRRQTYPAHLIDVYVVADNCTDATATLAREGGAFVVEREDTQRIGKGYALCYFFEHLAREKGILSYDAYLFFDADNVLRDDYFEKMHDAYCAGNRVLTSYRNSKNYGKNWISAGYALWFLREARHLNNARAILGSSAAIAGTGFLVDAELLAKNGGWKHFLLTEDLEFTADCVLQGERIGYCHAAELFDEQPESFSQSWRQRKRWAKGLFQTIRRYGVRLLGGALRGSWSCFDMLVSMMPAFLLSTLQLTVVVAMLVLHLITQGGVSLMLLSLFVEFWLFAYGMFLLVGGFALFAERGRICCRKPRAILLLLAFPVFMLTYIPLSLCALFTRVSWQPIHHKYALSTEQIEAAEHKKI